DGTQRIQLTKLADLLEAWVESYTYRSNEMASYFVAERVTRRLMADLARAAVSEGRRYAFTLGAGISLVAPPAKLGAVHCFLAGDPAPTRRGRWRAAPALALRPRSLLRPARQGGSESRVPAAALRRPHALGPAGP